MSEKQPDFITFSNWVGVFAAIAVVFAIGWKLPDYRWTFIPAVAGFVVLATVTLGLDWILRRAGGLGKLLFTAMSTVSFVVAVVQLIVWYKVPPF